MKILDHYNESLPIDALTIGIFDGVHLGHQAILKRLTQLSRKTAVVTFSNHPNEILYHTPITYLITLAHRLQLFEQMGISTAIVLPFTLPFSKQTAETFLTTLKQNFDFKHLVLGYDSAIGHDQNRNVQSIGRTLNFSIEYLKPILVGQTPISSSLIRSYILQGKFKEASALLGRPYSIQARVEQGKGVGSSLGFHTANLPVEHLALPPLGVYAVQVHLDQDILPAVANLGHAPTLHTNRPTYLEVHLLDSTRNLYDLSLDVQFIQFLRPEQKFDSPAALRLQIEKDILKTRALLSA